MHKWTLLLILASCTSEPVEDPIKEIRAVMSAQEAAWDRGDIPAFMAGYSDTICFIGRHQRTCGREAVTANYQRRYPDQRSMGDLAFGIHEVLMAGDRHAWSTGTWELTRTTDTLGGGFSLLWRKEAAGWRIVRDHTY